MIQLKIKPGVNRYQKSVIYINPKCGHKQVFDRVAPFKCQNTNCDEKIANVEDLIGESNCGKRVKYFAEGKL